MGNVVNLGDVIDLDKMSEFESVLLEVIKESQKEGGIVSQFVMLSIEHASDEEGDGGARLMYSLNPEDETGLVLFKGYLDLMQAQATRQLTNSIEGVE